MLRPSAKVGAEAPGASASAGAMASGRRTPRKQILVRTNHKLVANS